MGPHSLLLLIGLALILLGVGLYLYYAVMVVPIASQMCPSCLNDPTGQWEFGWSVGTITFGAIVAFVGMLIRGTLR